MCIYSSNNNDQTFKTKIAQSTNTTATTSVVDKQGSYETNSNQSIVEIKSRPLQRVGSDCGEGYFIDDRSEININFQKYRMVFVVNKDAVFYKKSAFRQAKKVRINFQVHSISFSNLNNPQKLKSTISTDSPKGNKNESSKIS